MVCESSCPNAKKCVTDPGMKVKYLHINAICIISSQHQARQHEYLIRVEESQNCNGQLGEEDQCQAEGELEKGGN